MSFDNTDMGLMPGDPGAEVLHVGVIVKACTSAEASSRLSEKRAQQKKLDKRCVNLMLLHAQLGHTHAC